MALVEERGECSCARARAEPEERLLVDELASSPTADYGWMSKNDYILLKNPRYWGFALVERRVGRVPKLGTKPPAAVHAMGVFPPHPPLEHRRGVFRRIALNGPCGEFTAGDDRVPPLGPCCRPFCTGRGSILTALGRMCWACRDAFGADVADPEPVIFFGPAPAPPWFDYADNAVVNHVCSCCMAPQPCTTAENCTCFDTSWQGLTLHACTVACVYTLLRVVSALNGSHGEVTGSDDHPATVAKPLCGVNGVFRDPAAVAVWCGDSALAIQGVIDANCAKLTAECSRDDTNCTCLHCNTLGVRHTHGKKKAGARRREQAARANAQSKKSRPSASRGLCSKINCQCKHMHTHDQQMQFDAISQLIRERFEVDVDYGEVHGADVMIDPIDNIDDVDFAPEDLELESLPPADCCGYDASASECHEEKVEWAEMTAEAREEFVSSAQAISQALERVDTTVSRSPSEQGWADLSEEERKEFFVALGRIGAPELRNPHFDSSSAHSDDETSAVELPLSSLSECWSFSGMDLLPLARSASTRHTPGVPGLQLTSLKRRDERVIPRSFTPISKTLRSKDLHSVNSASVAQNFTLLGEPPTVLERVPLLTVGVDEDEIDASGFIDYDVDYDDEVHYPAPPLVRQDEPALELLAPALVELPALVIPAVLDPHAGPLALAGGALVALAPLPAIVDAVGEPAPRVAPPIPPRRPPAVIVIPAPPALSWSDRLLAARRTHPVWAMARMMSLSTTCEQKILKMEALQGLDLYGPEGDFAGVRIPYPTDFDTSSRICFSTVLPFKTNGPGFLPWWRSNIDRADPSANTEVNRDLGDFVMDYVQGVYCDVSDPLRVLHQAENPNFDFFMTVSRSEATTGVSFFGRKRQRGTYKSARVASFLASLQYASYFTAPVYPKLLYELEVSEMASRPAIGTDDKSRPYVATAVEQQVRFIDDNYWGIYGSPAIVANTTLYFYQQLVFKSKRTNLSIVKNDVPVIPKSINVSASVQSSNPSRGPSSGLV